MYIELILGYVFLVIGFFIMLLSTHLKDIKRFGRILFFVAGFLLFCSGLIIQQDAELNKNAVSTQFFEFEKSKNK